MNAYGSLMELLNQLILSYDFGFVKEIVIDFSQTEILISDNIGCSQHIKTTIYAYNPNIKVLHPVSFLAQQLIQQ